MIRIAPIMGRLSLVLVLLMSLLMVPGTARAFSGAGTGDIGSPYRITTCAQLQEINDDLSAYYVLWNDIDCSSTSFTPLGFLFTGTLDGLSHTITGVTISQPTTDDIGLFRRTDPTSTIKNLKLADFTITGDTRVGGLVGLADGQVSHVSVDATVTGVESVGGIMGHNLFNGVVEKSSTTGGVEGGAYIGGLTGGNSGIIRDSYSRATVEGDFIVGGFAGSSEGTAQRVYAAGSVTSSDPTVTGGLLGIGVNPGALEGAYWDTTTTTQADACGTASGSNCDGASGLITAFMKDVDAITDGYGIDFPAGVASYRYIKFEITRVRDGGDTNCITGDVCSQFGELELLRHASKVSWPIGTTVSDPGANNLGLPPSRLIDGNPTTKWIDAAFSDFNQSAGHSEIIIDAGQALDIDGYNWATGDDQDQRDPVSWTISGSNDGVGYTELDAKLNQHGSVTLNRSTFIESQYIGPNFNTVWDMSPSTNSGYPFLVASGPQMVCEEATVSTNSVHVACDALVDGTPAMGDTTWQAQYRQGSSGGWTPLTLDDDTIMDATITGLLADTDYEIQFRYISENWGISPWGLILATTDASSDTDGDGLDDSIEDAGPNGGDANDDGTADSLQANVASLANSVTGQQVVVQSSCTTISDVATIAESTADRDAGYDYPAGLVGFRLLCGAPGTVATVTLYYYGNLDPTLTPRKFNSSTGTYTALPGATVDSVVMGSQPALKIVYQITDGSSLDQDGLTDGNILDPVGLGLLAVGAPNTGLGGASKP
jgi:hypothetical protein